MAQKQKPKEQADMTGITVGMLVWVEQINPTPEVDAFMKGKISAILAAKSQVEVTFETGKKEEVDVSRILERADFGTTFLSGFQDMVDMEILNDAELLENVRKRFFKDLIFTYVGPTLLVVNPFKKMPFMGQEGTRMEYIKHIIPAKDPLAYKDKPPNVYAVASEAYRSLFENEKNQSIVISGESGAGKTENAKFCMSLLTSIGSFELFKHDPKTVSEANLTNTAVTGHAKDIVKTTLQQIHQQDVSIEDKILGCNPILEAFGNSKTKRNNNSSRFGKYVSMMVDKKTRKIRGAEIVNYLLEKSRIIHQGEQERNFHVFYHMLEGSTPEKLEELRLAKNGKRYEYDWFEYLKKAKNYVSPGIDDIELFHEINRSFQALGMRDTQALIYQCVSAVLLLGNISFDGSTFGNETACKLLGEIKDIADLLGLTEKSLSFALTFKNRKVGNQVINSPLTLGECENCRDSLAKEIYERLFNWLVMKLNKTIKPQVEAQYISVGLLDIYGFEVFEVNTFEQLMINYTNEKLHQLYIFYVFKEEERVFINEGLQQWCSQIKFQDNTPVIELLEKAPVGIFNLLDESCSIASNTDDSFLQKIRSSQKGNPLLVNPKMPTKPTFTIIHTAKDVEYNVTGFRAKNKDETSVIILDAMGASSNLLVAEMFTKSDIKGDKFLGTKIRKEMTELMNNLNSCDVHFIRCLKPNELKVCNVFHQSNTLNQIRYLGVLDSLKVRKDSYPLRRSFQIFYKQFGDIGKELPYPILAERRVDFKPYAEKLINQFFKGIAPEHFLVGKTKVFMRKQGLQTVLQIYEKESAFKHRCATKLQRMFKAFKFRQGVKKFMGMLKNLKENIHSIVTNFRMRKLTKYIVRIQKFLRNKFISLRRKRLLDTAKMIQKYIKRRNPVDKGNRLKKSVITIQRWVRRFIKQKEARKMRYIKKMLQIAIDQAWIQILSKYATKIQKVWRGHRCRRKEKSKIVMIKEAGRQEKIRKNAVTIQKWARGYIVRKRIKKMDKAARRIQGYFKMVWLSELFQAMRKNIKIIQRFARMFIAKRRHYNDKYERFILPMERQFMLVKEQEENNFFGITDAFRTLMTSQNSSFHTIPFTHGVVHTQASTQGNGVGNSPVRFMSMTTEGGSPASKSKSINKRHEPDFQLGLTTPRGATSTPKPIVRYAKHLPQHWQYDSNSESIENILLREQEQQVLNNKIYLLTLAIDLELLCDISEIYTDPWTKTYKDILSNTLQKQSAIQLFEVGQTHTIAVSVTGKAYSWGLNDNGQLGRNDSGDRPGQINLPANVKIIQISSGEHHSLILGYDGTVWSFGSNQVGQLGIGNKSDQSIPVQVAIEPIQLVKAVGNTSFAVSKTGNLYTWPLVSNLKPYQIDMNSKATVVSVACGNQFALILMSNGYISAFGENLEGELGLGDTIIRNDPCVVEKLASQGEKIIQVECGFKHAIARSNLGKVFTWGWGEKGQLGHNSYGNELLPKQLQIKEKILQVSAAHKSTLILTDSHKILWCGTNRTITQQSYLIEFKPESKAYSLSQYTPVRIYPSWSHSMSIINVTYAQTRNVLTSNTQLRHKVVNQLVQKWVESNIHSVDPPMISQIANHIQEKHMKKTSTVPITVKTTQPTMKTSLMMTDPKKRIQTPRNSGWNSDRSYRSSFNTKFKAGPPTNRTQASNTASSVDEENNLSKLRDIKKRLIALKTIPQNKWSEQDVEFIRTIYKSNLSQLLDDLS